MARKMIDGFLLILAGIFAGVSGIINQYRLSVALLVVSALILVACGAIIFTRANYEGVVMEWSSLLLDVPYEINLFYTGNGFVYINISGYFSDYRVLRLSGVIPAGSTHLKVVKTNNASLGIAFLTVKPEEILITGGREL